MLGTNGNKQLNELAIAQKDVNDSKGEPNDTRSDDTVDKHVDTDDDIIIEQQQTQSDILYKVTTTPPILLTCGLAFQVISVLFSGNLC